MVKIPKGEEINFQLDDEVDTNDVQFKQAISRLAALGIRASNLDIAAPTLTIEQLAEQNPVVSSNSFLGTEHFRSLRDTRGLKPMVGSRLFSRLVRPHGEVEHKRAGGRRYTPDEHSMLIEEFYENHEIKNVSRAAADLPELPSHLKRKSTEEADSYSIRADSVLKIKQNLVEFSELVPGLGSQGQHGLLVMSDYIVSCIKENRLKRLKDQSS